MCPWIGAKYPGAAELHRLHVVFIPLENKDLALQRQVKGNGVHVITARRGN